MQLEASKLALVGFLWMLGITRTLAKLTTGLPQIISNCLPSFFSGQEVRVQGLRQRRKDSIAWKQTRRKSEAKETSKEKEKPGALLFSPKKEVSTDVSNKIKKKRGSPLRHFAQKIDLGFPVEDPRVFNGSDTSPDGKKMLRVPSRRSQSKSRSGRRTRLHGRVCPWAHLRPLKPPPQHDKEDAPKNKELYKGGSSWDLQETSSSGSKQRNLLWAGGLQARLFVEAYLSCFVASIGHHQENSWRDIGGSPKKKTSPGDFNNPNLLLWTFRVA